MAQNPLSLSSFMFRLLLITAVILLLAPLGARAQQTAEEIIQSAMQAYSEGNFARAISLFDQFEKDFGAAPEAMKALERAYALKCYSQVRLGKYADAVESITKYIQKFPSGPDVEELSYWKGYSQLKDEEPGQAYQSLDAFIKTYPRNPKILEAKVAMGTALLQQDKFKEGAAFFRALAPQLPPALAGRAQVFTLYCLLEEGDIGAALAYQGEIQPKADGFYPVALYHVLSLKLGDELLGKSQYREALRMFQRVWSKGRIQAWQNQRLEKLQAELDAAKRLTNNDGKIIPLEEAIGQIRQETGRLAKIADYDTALYLRMAQCFIQLDRHREACLILREAVKKMPDSAVLEQANFQMLVCLRQMERSEELISACTAYLEKYPQQDKIHTVYYLRGEAQQDLYQYDAAVADFKKAAEGGEKFQYSERANFLAGYNLLMQEKYAAGSDHLAKHSKLYPKGAMKEQAAYWAAMGQYFAKNLETARADFESFIKAYPKSPLVPDAVYRRAHVRMQQRNYNDAYKELEEFVAKYPDSNRFDEGSSLLGDAYFALGEIDRGIEAYRKVSPENTRMFEYSYFRIGQAYKALDEPDKMFDHYQSFIQKYPKSPKVVEALYHSAWVLRQKGQDEEARKIYWDAIRAYGNDPASVSVEDMLLSLGKLYKGPDRNLLLTRFSDLAEEAEGKGRKFLAARALWAAARSQPKESAAQAEKLFLQGSAFITPENGSPNLLADFADAQRSAGNRAKAEELYRGLLAWHPRSMQKDRAYAGLGLLAMAEGKEKAALDWFALFEKESIQSPLRSVVLSSRAELLCKRKQYQEAVAQLEEILKIPSARGLKWVEALNRIGEIYVESGDSMKALPYFERIYVMYGRWSDYVAKAYWQRGQALEKLNMADKALETYREFVANTHLKDMPEYPKAEQRIKQLGGAGT